MLVGYRLSLPVAHSAAVDTVVSDLPCCVLRVTRAFPGPGHHLLPGPPPVPAAILFSLPLREDLEWESDVMYRNIFSIKMTPLKYDCTCTLNIRACHLTEGIRDSEM